MKTKVLPNLNMFPVVTAFASLSLLAFLFSAEAAPPAVIDADQMTSISNELQKSPIGRETAKAIKEGPYTFDLCVSADPGSPGSTHIRPIIHHAFVEFARWKSAAKRAEILIRIAQQTRDLEIVANRLRSRMGQRQLNVFLQLITAPAPTYPDRPAIQDLRVLFAAAALRFVLERRAYEVSLNAISEGQENIFGLPVDQLKSSLWFPTYRAAFVSSGYTNIFGSEAAEHFARHAAEPLTTRYSTLEEIIDHVVSKMGPEAPRSDNSGDCAARLGDLDPQTKH